MKPITFTLTLLLLLCAGATVCLASADQPVRVTEQQADDHERRIQELERKIERLENELEALKSGKAETELSEEQEETVEADIYQPQEIQPTGREKLLPDFSVIVDTVGTASSSAQVESNRDQVLVRGLELAVQGYLYPQIRGDVIIAAEGEDLAASVHEAYASFLQIGDTDLSAIVGKKLLEIGKNNPVHRERWPFVTQPFVVRNLVHPDEGLSGQGVQLNYLLPFKGDLFGQLSAGVWKPSACHHEHEETTEEHSHELGLGLEERLYTGRLWLSRAIGDTREMELGLSAAGGSGGEAPGSYDAHLFGIDITYRMWGKGNKRVILQGEMLRQKKDTPGGDGTRNGYYLMGLHRSNTWNEVGLRYDWAALPAPQAGHDSGLSLFYTRTLTETSYARLQVTRGTSAEEGSYTSAFLQFVWGLGPHAHDLQ